MRARRSALALAAAFLWITVSPSQAGEARQAAGAAGPTASHDRREQGTYAEMRAYLGDADRAIAALEEGLRRGIFYSRWDFAGEVMSPLEQHPRFAAFWQANLDRLAEADRKSAMRLEVARPPG